ncbi:hypothetical protein ABZ807_09435 [Micromonospora sp. NPDC047548]|uniref:hypothetical protein n=1 Tax=Micromonospora sp. NPDC047548 TaxID=3155624 RepID=UPI00340B03EB
MARAATTTQPETTPDPQPAADAAAEQETSLSIKAILAAINDGADDDQDLVDTLNAELYRFGAQDPSMELPRSWQRVQRRIGVDPNQHDGVATAEQVAQFADRVGLAVTK